MVDQSAKKNCRYKLIKLKAPSFSESVAKSKSSIRSRDRDAVKADRAHSPLLFKEGWMRPVRKCREATSTGAYGVVSQLPGIALTYHPGRAGSERGHFLM